MQKINVNSLIPYENLIKPHTSFGEIDIKNNKAQNMGMYI